jgi:uncharacterized protein (DUF1697 family)
MNRSVSRAPNYPFVPDISGKFRFLGKEAILKTWIALLRGVNVGGNGKLPMKDLVTSLQRVGYGSVRTYIQSGNIVFQSAKGTSHTLSTQIATLIMKDFGFQPSVMLLSDQELSDAIRDNPFPKAVDSPKSLHLCFLAESPANPNLEALTRLKSGNEAFALKDRVLYLHTPDGYGDSRLAAKVEHHLGVDTTSRNWRTVNQLLEMADEIV